MKSEEKELVSKVLVKHFMQTWLPTSSDLIEMIIFNLPSSGKEGRYRVQNWYEGPLES